MAKPDLTSKLNSATGFRSRRSVSAAEKIRLYGWDSRVEVWHGPNELGCCSGPDKRVLNALRAAAGSSWYGSLNCAVPGEKSARFFVLVHDASDCAVALIYCDDSKTGPVEIVAVIPAERRAHLREDFAFEFLAFARFLGSISAGAELQIHDAIVAAMAEQRDSNTVVFSISSGLWSSDRDFVLSCCVEKIAVTLAEWLEQTVPAAGGSESAA